VIELRRVGEDAFDEIYPLLVGFGGNGMSRDHWQRMLFSYPWADGPHRGFGLYADGKPVGFLGTIFSRRRILGREERFCNFSSWIVDKEHRGASVMLMRPLVAQLPEYTIVGHTPVPVTVAVFSRLGFVPLESEELLLLPIPGVRGALRALGGSFSSAPDVLERELSGDELGIYRDISYTRVHHALLRRGNRRCYLVARLGHRRRIRVAELLYIGDREFFWENRVLAQTALAAATGAMLVSVDRRFAGPRVPFAIRRPRPRLYRPARPDIPPDAIDGLYSELMML